MKIVLAAPHFPPRFIGGVEALVRRLADGLRAQGDEPEVLCVESVSAAADGSRFEVDTSFGYPVHRLHLALGAAVTRLGFYYGQPHVNALIRERLDAIGPDILHLHSGYLLGADMLRWGRETGVSTFLSLHDYWLICPRIVLTHPNATVCTGPTSPGKCAWCLSTEQRRYQWLDRATAGAFGRLVVAASDSPNAEGVLPRLPLRQAVIDRQHHQADVFGCADSIIAPSRFIRDQMAAAGLPIDRVAVIRSGVMTRDRTQSSEREPGPVRKLGFLGQIAPHKGVHVLIDAVRRLPAANLTLTIHGDLTRSASYAEQLRALTAGDTRITFAGPYVSSELDSVMDDLDVVVVPSTWYENAPAVIFEAQRARKPVVASRLGGMREFVTHEQNGLLATPGDAADLARQLERLMDPSLVTRLSQGATPVRHFDEELRELRDKYAEVYERRRGTRERSHRPRE